MRAPPWGSWRPTKDFRLACAAWVAGWLERQEATWVAAEALQQGMDSHEIRVTAGLLEPIGWDKDATIDAALRKISGGLPSVSDAIAILVEHQVLRVVRGTDEELWEALRTAHWLDIFGRTELHKDLLPVVSKRLKELRDYYYAVDDTLEWGGAAATKIARERGEVARRNELIAECRIWATRELDLPDNG